MQRAGVQHAAAVGIDELEAQAALVHVEARVAVRLVLREQNPRRWRGGLRGHQQ